MIVRCWGDNEGALMQAYHDTEWGVPLHEDGKLFEFLILDAFQAGLSWRIILNKRENFRKAFDNFDYHRIAGYSPEKVESLRLDTSIVRNSLKINATVTNAQAFINVQREFGSFDEYLWEFTGNKPIQNNLKSFKEMSAKTELSVEISKDLRKRGFKFVGPTIVYAFMQGMGMVNDHLTKCFRYSDLNKA
ncbi:DNA-3-methyladenine glycosylase I [Chloroflexota bacterium]